ncbi:hypothetical protein N7490_006582 [Penicillium lividum]|nr:hypothetical protein N7490_006582 [Penicillium lividum]
MQKPISLSNARIITPVCYSLSKSHPEPSEKASRAIQAMRDAKRHDHAFYDSIWIGMREVFDDQGVEEIALNRYGRIQALQSRNEARGDIFKYAQRLSLLLGAHELQVIERTLPPEACTRGVSLRSVAINMLAKHLHVERRYILDENKRRSHYVSICERFGPGALLLLGESDGILSLWERDLNTEDIESICKYAKYNLRDWVKDCEDLNGKAGFLITEALRSCGWDGHSNRDTTLMRCLANSVDLGSLPSVPTTQEEAESRKRKNPEEEALPKRHCHDKVPILYDRTTSLPIESSSGEQSVPSEPRFDGSHPELSQEGVNATLDWDCSVHLDLDWDQFIEDQITESMNG